jgi:phospholipid/cholesterol/gamma-HCH transport system permease protein
MNSDKLFEIERDGSSAAVICLTGDWTLNGESVSWSGFLDRLGTQQQSLQSISVISSPPLNWDSRLLTFLRKLNDYAASNEIRFDTEGLPVGVNTLLQLSLAVPERSGAHRSQQRPSVLRQLGEQSLEVVRESILFTRFVGEWTIAMGRFVSGRARFRKKDLTLFLQSAGADALPIVSLISILVGAVLAFVGAVQLQMFGAEVYVANLVALGTVREMGAMMTAIIMAGRTGSAYAAQLGTMQVNEEIDALKTLGISPMEFLVLPRSLALIIMLPLLCLWSDALGILGGLIVGVALLDIALLEYLVQTQDSITLIDVAVGLIKSFIFAGVIALSGCLRGLQSGRNSSAVGHATTSAMVTAILLIVIWDALTTLIFNQLGV